MTLEEQSLEHTRRISPALAERIASVFATTQPRTRARTKALAAIKWRLKVVGRDEYPYLIGTLGQHWKLGPVHKAPVFDARDNEQMKLRYYQDLTGLKLEIELCES